MRINNLNFILFLKNIDVYTSLIIIDLIIYKN